MSRRSGKRVVPGVLSFDLHRHLSLVIKWIIGFLPQESEGFGDRLFLKHRMSLLSQMTSAPIDCLFKVRYQEAFVGTAESLGCSA